MNINMHFIVRIVADIIMWGACVFIVARELFQMKLSSMFRSLFLFYFFHFIFLYSVKVSYLYINFHKLQMYGDIKK